MLLKFLLGVLLVSSLLGAFVLAPKQRRALSDERQSPVRDGRRLRLLSWNIGNGDLEAESRAHAEDLPAVAKVIMDNDVDAVALQELTGADQLKLLLAALKNRYRGHVSGARNTDRVEAVLVKNELNVRFNDVPASDRFAAGAEFRLTPDLPAIVLVSVHADAFDASRRRAFTENLVDWSRDRIGTANVFIAGDFNLEVSVRNKTNLFTDDTKHDSESFAYLLKYFQDLGSDAGETSINERRIDYVFGPARVVLVHAEVLRTAAVGRMDHWPLLVEVSF